MAQGFHMVKTRIEADSRGVGLRSFPGFEDELRESLHGREWASRTRSLMHRISAAQPAAPMPRVGAQAGRVCGSMSSLSINGLK